MRTGGAKLASALIHYLRKCFDAAGMVTSQTSGHIIRALDEKGTQQVDALISVAGLDVQLYWFGHRIYGFDPYRLVQKAVLCDNQRGQQLLGAGGLTYFVCVFFI